MKKLSVQLRTCEQWKALTCYAAVVAVLQCHGEATAEVVWQGLWAIQHLAAVHAANAADLLNSGACAGIQPHALTVLVILCHNKSLNLVHRMFKFSRYIFWVTMELSPMSLA